MKCAIVNLLILIFLFEMNASVDFSRYFCFFPNNQTLEFYCERANYLSVNHDCLYEPLNVKQMKFRCNWPKNDSQIDLNLFVFEKFPSLYSVDVSSVGITQIKTVTQWCNPDNKTLSCLFNTSVRNFNASHNQLTDIPPFFFMHMQNITHIDFSYNNFTSLGASHFDGASKLTAIDFSHNKIASVENGTFSKLENLKCLNLSDNRITSIGANMFGNKEPHSLNTLNLDGNNLFAMENITPVNFPEIIFLIVPKNNFTCEYLKNWKKVSKKAIHDQNRNEMYCYGETATTPKAIEHASKKAQGNQSLFIKCMIASLSAIVVLSIFIRAFVCMCHKKPTIIDETIEMKTIRVASTEPVDTDAASVENICQNHHCDQSETTDSSGGHTQFTSLEYENIPAAAACYSQTEQLYAQILKTPTKPFGEDSTDLNSQVHKPSQEQSTHLDQDQNQEQPSAQANKCSTKSSNIDSPIYANL